MNYRLLFISLLLISSYSAVTQPKPIQITGIEVYNSQGKSIEIGASSTGDLSFSNEENYLRFIISDRNSGRYAYKLANFDKQWFYTDQNQIDYPGLPSGSYIFIIKEVDQMGNFRPLEASIPFQIETTWWKSWWMIAMIPLFITAYVFYSFRRQMKKNMVIKKLLEQEIERQIKELKESKMRLAQLNKKKDFIFSILSHDLRAPLTTLEGFHGLLIDRYKSLKEEEVRSHAINIKNSVAKSLDLLDNTLYWSLSQMNEITYSPTRVSISRMFEKLEGLYNLAAQKKEIKLEFHLAGEIYLFADENMTSIILRNLISNALKFTPNKRKVAIEAFLQGSEAVIMVEDEGSGIKIDNISSIFESNQHTIEKGTGNEKGTGLGLQLCRIFTEMNKGKISVENIQDSGSRFILILPAFNEQQVLSNSMRSDSTLAQ